MAQQHVAHPELHACMDNQLAQIALCQRLLFVEVTKTKKLHGP
jgi:hypothetical protein